jgi:hypothetical protein
MSKPRTCPQCLHTIGIEDGFHFTKDLIMVCDKCGKNVFPTDYMSETNIETAVKARTSPPTPSYDHFNKHTAASNTTTTTAAPIVIAPGVKEYPPRAHRHEPFDYDYHME